MNETMRTTLIELWGRLRAKQTSEEHIRWMLIGVMIRAGYQIGLLKRGEPIPESMYQQVSHSVQKIMNEPEQ